MSDEELIAQLKNSKGWPTLGKAAAARIDALTAERDEALNQLDSARHSVDVLEKRVAFVEGERRKTFQALLKVKKIRDEVEAKLAKAVEALGNIARQKKTAQIEAEGETEFSDFEGAYDMCIDVARATLEEIEEAKG